MTIKTQIYQAIRNVGGLRNINYGGCCVFASILANHLQHLVPTRIAVYEDPDDEEDPIAESIDSARAKLTSNTAREWNRNGVYFNHVVVECDIGDETVEIDSSGIFATDGSIISDCVKLPGYLTIPEATELAASSVGWNWWFDRDQIPEMERLVNKAFA
jgi:hypothetical protein